MASIKRPKPGSSVTREVRFDLCLECDNYIGQGRVCSAGCPSSGKWLVDRKYVVAVYSRTDKFLRDEPATVEKKGKNK